MTWRIQPAREAFADFAPEWDRLNRELYQSHPLFDSRFVGPLLEYFASGKEVLCTHRTGDVADGAMLLVPRGLGRWALFLPSQAQVAPVLLCDVRLLELLMAALPGYAWSLDLLAQDPQFCPDWSGLRLSRVVSEHALTMAVETDGDFDAYWQSRPRKLQNNLRRYERRATEEFDGSSVATIVDPQQMTEALTRYGLLETLGWKGREGTAIAFDNTQGRFYAKILEAFATVGQASVVELHAGDRLAASRLIVYSNHLSVMLKTTYDESLASIAPGRQLLYRVLRDAFANAPSATVEFYTNATRDQAEWATSLRYICHHQIIRNHWAAGLFQLARAVRPTSAAADTEFRPLTARSFASVGDIPPVAKKLFEDAERQSPEFSLSWFANLQATVFTHDAGVRYYLAEFLDRPLAALPLRLTTQGPIRGIAALGNYYTSLYSPILAAGGGTLELTKLLATASRDHGGAHVVRLAPMDPEAASYEATLTALRSAGWLPFRFFCFGNWTLKVDRSWKDYLAGRSSQLRNTIKRKSKKFAAEGGTLEVITEPQHAKSTIRDFNLVYSRSWKKPEPYPEFVPGLVRWLAEKGWLRLGIARLRGEPIAAQLWIVSYGKARIFKLAHDEQRAHVGAGTLLTADLMEHVIDRDQVRKVDYLIGDDVYKREWMSDRRERWGIIAYNLHTPIGLVLLAKETIGQLIRRLKNRL